jgi:hypothetical protein
MGEPAMSALSPSEYNAILRSDLGFFAQRCFSELNPQAPFAPNWHLEIIAAKLTEVRQGKIRRLIINMSEDIDLVMIIFHPTSFRRPTASLDGSWVE